VRRGIRLVTAAEPVPAEATRPQHEASDERSHYQAAQR
jgi:hypothetical protein